MIPMGSIDFPFKISLGSSTPPRIALRRRVQLLDEPKGQDLSTASRHA